MTSFHLVIEARLASEVGAIVTDEKSDRAAVLALPVCELIAVNLADLLSVAEVVLSASLAHKILTIFVLTGSSCIIKQSSIVDLAALVAVVKCSLFKHELGK